MLTEACQPLLDPALPDGKLRATVFAKIPRAALTQALEDITATVRAPDDVVLAGTGWGDIVAFEAFFRNRGSITWYVMTAELIHYTALRRRNVCVSPSWCYADPRAGLLTGSDGEATAPLGVIIGPAASICCPSRENGFGVAGVNPGVVIVWKLDRLARSIRKLLDTTALLSERGVELYSLTENINTTTPSGKLTFHIFAALAEFERDILRQRVNAGLKAARRRGRLGGRPKSLTEADLKKARALLRSGDYTKGQVADELKVARHTLWRALSRKATK